VGCSVAAGVVDVIAVLRRLPASDYVARLADDRVGLILTETDEVAAINMIDDCTTSVTGPCAAGRWGASRSATGLKRAAIGRRCRGTPSPRSRSG
jgi:hypothetical protein